MDGYRISELAARTGFSASALRFYEQAGLLPEAARTPGGYRSYGEGTVDRLRFIARAKQLGLPLEEIRELTAVWDAGACAPVQHRLADLLAAKITEVNGRIRDLTAFRAQLSAARGELGGHTPDGPCDNGCGCLAEPGSGGAPADPQPVRLLAAPPATTAPGPPVACSLTSADQRARVAEWASLLDASTSRQRTGDGVRFAFRTDPELAARAAGLAAAERQCCPFLDFTIELTADGMTLAVRTLAGTGELAIPPPWTVT